MTALRKGAMWGTTVLRRRLLVSLEIDNTDRAYDWFLAWMAHQAKASSASTSSKLQGKAAPWLSSHELSVQTMIEKRKNGSSSVFFKLVAGPGTHWLKYQGAWMQVSHPSRTSPLGLTFQIRSTVNAKHAL